MIRKTLKRAWKYYQLYGRRRFLWAISFKLQHKAKRMGNALRQAWRTVAGPDHHLMYQTFPAQDRVTEPTRSAGGVFRSPTVAIIADLNLPQCRKYRVMQKLESMEHMGIRVYFSHWQDTPRSMDMLQTATSAIFYRVQNGGLLESYLAECRRLKITTAYDIDDPIFSRRIYEKNENLNFLTSAEKRSLLESTELYRQALEKCDVAIVSTPRMAQEVEEICLKPAYVWRNAVDQETAAAVQLSISHIGRTSDALPSKTVTIAYASGSRAHEADFRVVEQALGRILREYPDTRLSVIGHLKLPDSLRVYENRISETGFSEYSQYIETLGQADINIVPLVPDDFNDCKSAIRFMEAALVGVPTIASSIGDFRNILRDGETGFLAASSDDWYQQLRLLVNNPELRSRVGSDAHSDVSSTLGTREISNSLPKEVKDLLHGQ